MRRLAVVLALASQLGPALPSVCVVSFWETWGPCVGDCNFALSVRNRDVIRPPFPERIRDGRLAIRPCPVLYQVQTCDLEEPCAEGGVQTPSPQTSSARLPPRLHKFGAADNEDNFVDKSGAAIHADGGVAHKAPVQGPPSKVPVADAPLVEAQPPAISVPSWQAESFRGREFRTNDTDEPFAGATNFASATKPEPPIPAAAPTTLPPASTKYYVANISASTDSTLQPLVAEGGVPRARFSLRRRPAEDSSQEFVPLHQGAAAIEVAGETKRPIALAPTTAKPKPTTTTATSTTTTEAATTTTEKAETTTKQATSTAAKTTSQSQPTTKTLRLPTKNNGGVKSEVAPSVVSSTNQARKDVVRKAMQIPRSAKPIAAPPAPVLRIDEQEAKPLPTIYFPEATRAPASASTPRRIRPLTTPLPKSTKRVLRLPTKPPPQTQETEESESIHSSVFTAKNGVRLPKETLVGFVPAAKDEEVQAPVAKTKITILGPPNQPNEERVKTPVFAPKGLASAKAVSKAAETSSPSKAALPVFSKRTKAKKAKKTGVRQLRWWEVLALTPKPSTLRPGRVSTAKASADQATPSAATQPSLVFTTTRPSTTQAPSEAPSKIIAGLGDKCGGRNPRCCRPEPIVGRQCPNGRRPQNVVRWGRNAADRTCVPYNYGYCGYQAEIDDGRPLKFKSHCESDCFSDEEKAAGIP